MAELKTKVNNQSVVKFLNALEDKTRREDSLQLLKMMEDYTKAPAKMWGDSIIGFGDYRYKYSTGREGDWFRVGFSPRKQNISLYIIADHKPFEHLLNKLGKYKTGKSCIYINKLADIDMKVLQELIQSSFNSFNK